MRHAPATPPTAMTRSRPPSDGASHEGVRYTDLVLDGVLAGARFTACTFVGCTFRGARFDGCTFTDSDFLACDLSHLGIPNTAFRGVVLERTRATAVDWGRVRAGVRLELDARDSTLDFGRFDGLDLTHRRFERCSLVDASFASTVLVDASLRDSDLGGARFVDSDLRGADLRRARGYAIDVRRNLVAGMRVSLPEAAALLAGLEVAVDG